jgi:hypothetical protein
MVPLVVTSDGGTYNVPGGKIPFIMDYGLGTDLLKEKEALLQWYCALFCSFSTDNNTMIVAIDSNNISIVNGTVIRNSNLVHPTPTA